MIEREVFQYWMGCIADRTNRVLSPPTYQEYYKALSGELTNDEFVEAARLVFRNAEFWPAPKDFIDAIRPDPKLEAAGIFNALRTTYAHRDSLVPFWVAEEIERELGRPTLEAFRAIGGAERLRTMEASTMGLVARDFTDAYVRAKTEAAKPPTGTKLFPVSLTDTNRRALLNPPPR